MRGAQGEIEHQGARLAFVGNGTTRQAREFSRKYAPGSAIFTDPSAYTYRAIGARSGVASTLGGVAVHGVRAMRGRHFQTSIEGRPFQHGAVLIAMPGDLLAYAYVSRIAGDHPPSAAVLGALRNAVAKPSRAPFVWTSPTVQERIDGPAEPAAAAPPSLPIEPPAPPMPPWPGAPDRTTPPPRAPRWSFQVPPSEPPRSAAG